MSSNQIVDQAIELEQRGEEKLDELADKDGPYLEIRGRVPAQVIS